MRRRLLTILALCALPLQSCCSLARLFCGPDKSAWVSVSFQTPELAVRTFLEALRRDDPEVIYQALSESLREHLGIDEGTIKIAWPRIRDENPGMHLAGYADVPPPIINERDGTASVELDVEGRLVHVTLVSQCRWQVRYRRPGAEAAMRDADVGSFVDSPAELASITLVSEDPSISQVTLNALRVPHDGVDEIPMENLDFAGFQRSWHISSFDMLGR
jgi:hypothetical protein